MVCGGPLEYLTEAISVTCIYCGKEERDYIRCPLGHYVCEVCHGKGAYEAVKDLSLSARDTDPLALASLSGNRSPLTAGLQASVGSHCHRGGVDYRDSWKGRSHNYYCRTSSGCPRKYQPSQDTQNMRPLG